MILASLSPEQTLKDPPPFFLQSPNNNNNNNNTTTKRVWTFFIHKRRSDGKAAAEEKRETMMTRCVVYSRVLMRSLLFLFARCFLDILYAFPSKFLKIKLTINLNLLFSQQWRTGDASPGGRFTTTALSFLLSKE